MEQRGVSKKVTVDLSGNDNLQLLKGRKNEEIGPLKIESLGH